MAIIHTYIDLPRSAVWEALADGRRYAEWVVGTRDIRSVDERWPAPGAQLHFTVGYGPFMIEDRTVVRISEEGERLELEVKAGPFGAIRVAIGLMDWGEGTIVVLDEHPLKGISATLHSPPAELLILVRNRLMLRNLKGVAQRIRAASGEAGPDTPKEPDEVKKPSAAAAPPFPA